MKLAKRAFSLILVLLMILALVACGESGTPTDKDPGKTPGGNQTGDKNPSKDFDLPERPVSEMEGKTYVVIQHDPETDPFGYSEDSLLAQRANERINEVQELYGCTIQLSQIPYDDKFATSIQALTFAENSGDLIFSHNQAQLRKTLGTGGSSSLMQDLLQLDHIINFWDMEKWGNITARETMMAGGTFYGVAPNLWINYTPLPYYQVVYNKDMLTEFGATDPQELWEQNAWDRDEMLEQIVKCYDDSSSDAIWGMTASMTHMMRATFLTTGQPTVIVDKINADGTAEWSHGLQTPDAKEALSWLQDALTNYAKHFNNERSGGWEIWHSHEPLIAGQSAFALTRPSAIFDYIVTDMDNFGLTVWAGADSNVVSGYYENSSAIAIPLFAQNVEHSAFLMYDLFEGLAGVEDFDDVVDYYRDTYFATDLDVEYLLRSDAKSLQYSYWPNGGGDVWTAMGAGFVGASSVQVLIDKNVGLIEECITTHMLPNQVVIEGYRAAQYFD